MQKDFFLCHSDIVKEHSFTQISSKDGIDIYRVNFKFTKKCIPSNIKFTWEEKMQDIASIWSPTCGRTRGIYQIWNANTSKSRFFFGAPLISTISGDDKNKFTISASDVECPIQISLYVNDSTQEEKIKFIVTLFSDPYNEITEYSFDLRIDTRNIPFYESIMAVSSWWEEYGYKIPKTSSQNEEPLYSTWYNYHRKPKDLELLADLQIASKMGIKTIIIDDGWQLEGENYVEYDQCGEWKVASNRFDNLKCFVEQAHTLGIKVMLWFTVPFIGYNSPLFKKFKHKYLYLSDVMCAGILDPRFPDIREFLINTYKQFLLEYDIDGFKLDFIDSFKSSETESTEYEKMDILIVENAVKTLLEEIKNTLDSIKPDLMYEYRQQYVGPAILKYATMLRVADCAFDAVTNRIGIVDLRLLNYPLAIHSDMLYWSKSESPMCCMKQLLNIMFSVPQISVKLCEIPEMQKKVLQNYLNYWNKNKDILLHGIFKTEHPEQNYTVVSSENKDKRIVVIYSGLSYIFDGKNVDIFNCAGKDFLLFDNSADKKLSFEIFDYFGALIESGYINPESTIKLNLPQGALISIKNP